MRSGDTQARALPRPTFDIPMKVARTLQALSLLLLVWALLGVFG